MATFTLSNDSPEESDVTDLYRSVGWTTYTRDPGLLRRAISNSSLVVTATSDDGSLVGLVRAVSDDATICYVQDLLVRPDQQASGIGRALLDAVKSRYSHVRQTVLITDDAPGQRAFYEKMGFTEGADFAPEPLRMFALMR